MTTGVFTTEAIYALKITYTSKTKAISEADALTQLRDWITSTLTEAADRVRDEEQTEDGDDFTFEARSLSHSITNPVEHPDAIIAGG